MQHHLLQDLCIYQTQKGKEIAKTNYTHQYELVSEKGTVILNKLRVGHAKNLALLAKYFKKLYKPTNNNLRTSSNSKNKTEDTEPRYNNEHQSRQFGNQRTMTVCWDWESVGTEQGVPLQAEQADWLEDTYEEIDEQELEAHYSFMAKIQEVLPEESSSTEQPLEHVQNNDENNVFANERQHSAKHAAECADERAALANLIANLTLDTEENKYVFKAN
ncbi:hypothetical protein Tco_0497166 [Tanacetum coccineum]